MKLKVFVVFDQASGVYDRPLCFRALGEALRFWKSLVLNAETQVGRNPEDFSFYAIGEFDDSKGEFIPHDRYCVQTAEEVVSASRQIERGALHAVNGGMEAPASVGGTE